MQENTQVSPAQVAQEFMTRTKLEGREVDVYAQTFNWLSAIMEGKIVVVLAEEFKAIQADAALYRGLQEEEEEITDAELEDVL